MTNPEGWWIFQPRGRRRRQLTPLGIAWTVAFYLLVGVATADGLKLLVEAGSPVGPVLLVLLGSLGWTAFKVCVDGQFLRAAAWWTGVGWSVVVRLLTEAPVCGTLIFGGGLPGVSPGTAPCLPHQDFMAVVFVAAWVTLGPLAGVVLGLLELYRWQRLRRDPLHAFRLLAD